MLDLNTIIIAPALPLLFDATKSHAQPTVEFPELIRTSRERRRKVASDASHDRIEFLDQLGIQVMAAFGQFPHAGLVFLQGFGSHLYRVRLHVKPQEGKALPKGRNARFLRTQRQAKPFGDELLDRMPCLFRLALGPAQDNEIVSVSHKAKSAFVEMPVQEVEGDIRQQWRHHAANKRANFCYFSCDLEKGGS